MEFGKIANIENINWDLPDDDPLTEPYLAKFENSDLKIYFGTPAWGHKEWIGKIYPEKTKPAEFLYYYSRYYNCIELNTTHYRIPTEEQAKKWLEQVPSNFIFCPKVFQGISHEIHGLKNYELLMAWVKFLENLGKNCGPSFLQLSPHFGYAHKTELFDFLKRWPAEFELALEFRHPSWFRDGKILPALTEYLQSRHIGLVITDVAGRRDVLHTSISAPFSMLRLIGNNLHPTDFSRATEWIKRFKQWENMGLERMFLFIHQPDDILAPEMTDLILDQMQSQGGWNLIPTKPTAPQLTLNI